MRGGLVRRFRGHHVCRCMAASRLSFLWLSRLSLRGQGVKFVHCFCGRRVCLRMVAESNGCSELVA